MEAEVENAGERLVPTGRPLKSGLEMGARPRQRAQRERRSKVCTYDVQRREPKRKRIAAWCCPLSEGSEIWKPLGHGREWGAGVEGVRR